MKNFDFHTKFIEEPVVVAVYLLKKFLLKVECCKYLKLPESDDKKEVESLRFFIVRNKIRNT